METPLKQQFFLSALALSTTKRCKNLMETRLLMLAYFNLIIILLILLCVMFEWNDFSVSVLQYCPPARRWTFTVIMENVFDARGCVTETMIVRMTRMNRTVVSTFHTWSFKMKTVIHDASICAEVITNVYGELDGDAFSTGGCSELPDFLTLY